MMNFSIHIISTLDGNFQLALKIISVESNTIPAESNCFLMVLFQSFIHLKTEKRLLIFLKYILDPETNQRMDNLKQ